MPGSHSRQRGGSALALQDHRRGVPNDIFLEKEGGGGVGGRAGKCVPRQLLKTGFEAPRKQHHLLSLATRFGPKGRQAKTPSLGIPEASTGAKKGRPEHRDSEARYL